MTFISYAQNFEDVMLWRALKHVESGFYIDVGAWSPDVDSVTRAFYEHGWRGINIEPNSMFLQQLNERRPRDINLGVAVSDHDGRGKIAILDNPGLSTLDEAVAAAHEQSGYAAEIQDVELVTLKQICKTYLSADQPVHFLKVDVEGLEQQVLRGSDWESYRPWVVLVEATLPMSQVESYGELESILESAGYRFCYGDGLNRFYVAEEHADLATAFRYPPNVFDEFVSYRLLMAEKRTDEKELELAGERESRARLKSELAGERESRARLESELAEVYASKSWRITWPLRKMMAALKWLSHCVIRALRALVRLPGHVMRWVVSRLITFVLRRERLKRFASSWLRRHPQLKQRLRRFAGARGFLHDARRNSLSVADLSDLARTTRRGKGEHIGGAPTILTPHAHVIYTQLRKAIEEKNGESK